MDKSRNSVIVRTSVLGIAANLLLALFKAGVGIITRSIAVTLDAVNNITDAGSSVITIGGTLLAAKKPDREHPYGHGRIEYMSAMILGAIVMSAGLSSFAEAVRKILHPQEPAYTVTSLVIIGVCVLVKIALGRYVIDAGKRTDSETLTGSGKDALMDAVISASTLAAALIFIFTGVSLEAWLGAVISLVIIRTGLDMVQQTFSEMLGERVDAHLARQVRQTVESFPEVCGVYDMMFNDYGPTRVTGALHIEVDERMRADEISELTRRIEEKVWLKLGVQLTAIGIYSMNTGSEEARLAREEITAIAMGFPHVLQVHGFYLKEGEIRFDVIVEFGTADPEGLCRQIEEKVKERYPQCRVTAYPDVDYSFSE